MDARDASADAGTAPAQNSAAPAAALLSQVSDLRIALEALDVEPTCSNCNAAGAEFVVQWSEMGIRKFVCSNCLGWSNIQPLSALRIADVKPIDDPLARVELARILAKHRHARQMDKSGLPYMDHLERVAAMLPDADAKTVALLHDIVEDTPTTLDELRDFHSFPEHIVAAVDAVSKREGETYVEFVERSLLDPIGRRVKYCDLLDNSSPARMAALPAKEQALMGKRYAKAIARLESAEVTVEPPCATRA